MTDPQARMVCGRAVSYSESKLGVQGVRVVRLRIGGGAGDCAMAEVSTPVGLLRVLFTASGEGSEGLWQPYAVSKAFQWSDYVGDSDGGCGLNGAGLQAHRDLPKTGWATA